MREITMRERFRYKFDNFMAKGPIAMIGGLGLVSFLLIFLMAVFVYVFGIAPVTDDGVQPGLIDIAWANLMRTLDAGTMGGDAGSWPYLLSMLAVTFGGIFVVSTFIGVLTSGIESKLEDLRKGRSFVVESGHTVIFGWSEQVFSIISEIVEANGNKKNMCIAILADKDKVEMEDEIESKISDTKTTRIVCRSGNPMDLSDIEIVNPHAARSIIVLGTDADDPDSNVIKTILAITNHPNRKPEPYHIVSEIRDPKNLEIAQLVGKNEAKLVLVGDLIARIMVQTCRQSGLSTVYTELLDFGGDEIYFHEEPGLVGKTYKQSLFAYADSAIMGIQKSNGVIQINPAMDTVFEAGDKVIAISEDDDTVRMSEFKSAMVESALIRQGTAKPKSPEKNLILGWNQRGATIVRELDQYVANGSSVTVVADWDGLDVELLEMKNSLKNSTLQVQNGQITDRKLLEQISLQDFDHIITLSDSDRDDVQGADAKTLITLLHLRELAQAGKHKCSIVSEMLDVRNRELAHVTRADDFIVSDKLIALMLSQLSENGDLHDVFTDLFDPDGSEIYLKPVSDYVELDRDMNFYTVVEAAAQKNETAIGYKLKAFSGDASQDFGVRVNPKKSDKIKFGKNDKIIVLAED